MSEDSKNMQNAARGEVKSKLSRRGFMTRGSQAIAGGTAFGASILAGLNGARAASGDPIIVGSMLPLTGAAASDAIGAQHGLEMAIAEVNAMGGILGRPLQSSIVDTREMSGPDVLSAVNRLIDRDGAHAIITCYNHANNVEYEPIADAGIIYMHVNTVASHDRLVSSDPDRYFGCFMACPPETYYGANLPFMLAQFRDSGVWKPKNNTIAMVIGSIPYSMVIAQQIKESAPSQGFEVVFEETVPVPTTEWGAILDKIRPLDPAVIVNTDFFAGDLANFQRQFVANPTNSLVYLQYGALLQSFADIAKDAAVGVLTSTMTGVIHDEIGLAFIERLKAFAGADANYDPASYTYTELYHWAIASAMVGGPGEPGNHEQNRKVADAMRALPYRSVCGAQYYNPATNSSQPYPLVQKDASLGLPSQTFQIKSADGTKKSIYPAPYGNGEFEIPSWFR